MIQSKRMKKVTVVGSKDVMKKTVETLYDLKSFHITEHVKETKKDYYDIGKPFEENEEISDLLVKLRSIKSYLDIEEKEFKTKKPKDIKEIREKIIKIQQKISDLQKNKDFFKKIKEILTGDYQEDVLDFIEIEPEELKSKKAFVGFVVEDIDDKIRKTTEKFSYYSNIYESVLIIAVFVDSKITKDIKNILEKNNFIPFNSDLIKEKFPEIDISWKSKKKDVVLEDLTKSIKHIEEKKNSIKKKNTGFILNSEKVLLKKSKISESPLKFGVSEHTFMIKGWVPEEDVKKVEQELKKISNNKIFIEINDPDKGENVPIAFKHPELVKPFEFFMNLYTLPSYKEIDPTFFMFLTFPIFFGFMLGDVGYGIVTLIIFMLLKKKIPGAKDPLNAMVLSSLSTIVFGILFGEYFGLEEFTFNNVHYVFPHILSRSHQIQDLITISIMIGVTHLFIGYAVGFYNILRQHGIKDAVLEKGGWMILTIVMIYLVRSLGFLEGKYGEFIATFLPGKTVIYILSAIAVALIIKGEGITGAVELPALLSNLLSYGRLMAVGLASVSLAAVVNDLAAQLFASGIVGIFAGILILVLGHTINIMLGILSPFLHSLRLHYV
ncbi:hypothetical protein GF327_08875, partial [Candidatus Woesearchaeota archaeon]|nr:hypothetical protein [Candidatus Woesearchaeota archaeon]